MADSSGKSVYLEKLHFRKSFWLRLKYYSKSSFISNRIDLLTFHDLLAAVDGVGRKGSVGQVVTSQFDSLLGFGGRRSGRGGRRRCGCGRRRRVVDEIVDGLVLRNSHLAFTHFALLELLGKGRLRVGCQPAADTQY